MKVAGFGWRSDEDIAVYYGRYADKEKASEEEEDSVEFYVF